MTTTTPKEVSGNIDIAQTEPMVGVDETINELELLLELPGFYLFLTGDSGSGKTHAAKYLAKRYAEKHNCRAWYVQLHPESSRSVLYGGIGPIPKEEGDSSKSFGLGFLEGPVTKAIQAGDILVVDEVSHAPPEVVLMFNGILDLSAIIDVGGKARRVHKQFRAIFTGNTSKYSGNSALPESFVNRIYTKEFPMLSEDIERQITLDMVKRVKEEYGAYERLVHLAVLIGRSARRAHGPENDPFVVSPRNMSRAVVATLAAYEYITEKTPDADERFDPIKFSKHTTDTILGWFSQNNSGHDREMSVQDLKLAEDVQRLLRILYTLGSDKWLDILMGAFNVNTDTHSVEFRDNEPVRAVIEGFAIRTGKEAGV